MTISFLRLKKNEDRRLRAGHLWIYSNEIDTTTTPLKQFTPGQEVLIEAADKSVLGRAYVNPHSLITARLLTRNPSEALDTDFFIQRIEQAYHLRNHLFNQPYYRLVFSESDDLPGLIIDRFNDTFVLQMNTAGMDIKTDLIIDALQHLFPSIQSILLRNDSNIRLAEGLPKEIRAGWGTPPDILSLEENETHFQIPLWQGQKTGWFYDHRLNRRQLKHYVAHKRVLDVFSYMGAWAIPAAIYGAKEVTCIDSSPLAKQWIPENAKLNGLSDNTIRVITEDAFIALKNLIQAKEQFDVIVLDPPAFAKKQKDKKEGLLAYQRLNEAALKLLTPEGILLSCSCSMHMSEEEFVQVIRKASLRTHSPLQLLSRGHQGPDHPIHLAIPETNYLKMLAVRKIKNRYT